MNQQNDAASRLLEALRRQGFYRSGNRIVAPHATLWLPCDALPFTDLAVLEREAARRLARKRRHRQFYASPYDWDCAMEDAEALLDAVDEVMQQTWLVLPKAS